jgi:hypothetical protein
MRRSQPVRETYALVIRSRPVREGVVMLVDERRDAEEIAIALRGKGHDVVVAALPTPEHRPQVVPRLRMG